MNKKTSEVEISSKATLFPQMIFFLFIKEHASIYLSPSCGVPYKPRTNATIFLPPQSSYWRIMPFPNEK